MVVAWRDLHQVRPGPAGLPRGLGRPPVHLHACREIAAGATWRLAEQYAEPVSFPVFFENAWVPIYCQKIWLG